MTTLTAIILALAVMSGLYHFARHVAGHAHQPSRAGRCAICGLDIQEQA